MATIGNDPNGRKRILFVAGDGSRKTIRLGKMDRKTAETCLTHIEKIIGANMGGGALPEKTYAWLADLPDVLHGRLAAVGLVKARTGGRAALGAFIDAYLAGRPDYKSFTIINFKQVRRWAVEHFGAGRDMNSITPGDAERFRQYMIDKGLGENSMRRVIGRCRQLFKAAIRRELVRGCNPFEGMAAAVRADKSRQYFVKRVDTQRIIDACPDAQWKLMIALSRYGGLRCPSEHLALRWGDVDFEHNRIRVPSPKTEHHEGGESRIIPLFPELRPHLLAVFDEAEPGTEHVITRYRDAASNLRTQLGRIIDKAKVKPWPKPWHNMRSTRQTELAERYPIHVVCQWIGNSRAVAQEHYLQVTDAHFAQAIAEPNADEPVAHSAAQNPAQCTAESSSNGREAVGDGMQKTTEIPGNATSYVTLPDCQLPPVGIEPTRP